jgi:hypothetical protein
MRAILQLFGIKVLVYPDRVEIKGTIPPQVLRQGEEPELETGLVITHPCRSDNPTSEIPFVSEVKIQSGSKASKKKKSPLSYYVNK